jgi:hypothetical protein
MVATILVAQYMVFLAREMRSAAWWLRWALLYYLA